MPQALRLVTSETCIFSREMLRRTKPAVKTADRSKVARSWEKEEIGCV